MRVSGGLTQQSVCSPQFHRARLLRISRIAISRAGQLMHSSFFDFDVFPSTRNRSIG